MALIGKSIDAATAVGPGTPIVFDKPLVNISMQTIFTGAPTAIQVYLDGSLDGINWTPVHILGDNGANGSGNIASNSCPPVIQIRANLVTLSGGSSPTVTVWIAGSDPS